MQQILLQLLSTICKQNPAMQNILQKVKHLQDGTIPQMQSE